jgi:hypothetical protein
MAMSSFVEQLPKVDFSLPPKSETLPVLRKLLEDRALTPFVDRAFPLEQAREAIRYLESGNARRKIVLVTVAGLA